MGTTMKIDLSTFKEKTSAHLPEGTYTVEITDVEATISNKVNAKTGKKSPGFILYMAVADGEHKGLTIIDRLWNTEASMFRIVNLMQAAGLPTPRKAISLDLARFIGKRVDIEVEDGEPYKGRVKSEVRGYARPSGAAAAAEEEDVDLDDVTYEEVDEETGEITEADSDETPEEEEEVEYEEVEVEEDEEPEPEPEPEPAPKKKVVKKVVKKKAAEPEPEALDLDAIDLG